MVALGAAKRVFVFNKFVIKTPRNIFKLKDWVQVMIEPFIYSMSREWKLYLVPTFGLPLLPISIQPRVRTFTLIQFRALYPDSFYIPEFAPEYLWKDNRYENFGIYKDRFVKIDFTYSRNFLLRRGEFA